MGGKHFFTIVVAVVIASALLLKMFMFQVRTDQVAIVLTFGRQTAKDIEPGPHFRWPWPIQVLPSSTLSSHSELVSHPPAPEAPL